MSAPTNIASAADALRGYNDGSGYRPFDGTAAESAQEVSRQIMGLCAVLSSVCVSASEGEGINVNELLLARAFDGIASLATVAVFLGEGGR